MNKRVLICVGTAVGLLLSAACGFLLGSSLQRNTLQTQDGQSAYYSSLESESSVGDDGDSEKNVSKPEGDKAQDAMESEGDTAQDASESEENMAQNASESEEDRVQNASESEEDRVQDASLSVSGELSADFSTDNALKEEDASEEYYEYIVFAENGTLVVYYSDGTTVYFDSGVDVQHLPEETRDQAEQGITFQGEEELFGFLESYSS